MASSSTGYMYTRVWEIHELLYPKPDDLTSPDRFAVREAEMFMWDEKRKKKKKRFFFLFNDILLLCKRETHKRYWLRIHITLRSPYVSVEDIDNSSFNNEFRLHCRSRSFIVYATTGEQKKEWVQDLRRSIEGTHPEEKKKTDGKKEEAEPKEEVKKHKREKTEKTEKAGYDEDDPEPETKKKEERERKPKKPSSKKPPKPEENLLPFDPFAPVSAQQRPPNSNPFSPGQVANPFFGGGIQQPQQQPPMQHNLIATAPLAGGNFDYGFNQPMGSLQANMGLLSLNQPSSNPVGGNTSSNPFNPSVGMNPVNPSVGFNQTGAQPQNPYAAGGFNVAAGANPYFPPSFNSQPSNPFSAPPANNNPFLNNPSSAPFSQNPLF